MKQAGRQSDKLTLYNKARQLASTQNPKKKTYRDLISEVGKIGEGGVTVAAGAGVPAGAGAVLEEVADEHGQIHVAVIAVAPEALGNSRRPQPQVGHRRDPTDDGRRRDGQLIGEQHRRSRNESRGRWVGRRYANGMGGEKPTQRNAADSFLGGTRGRSDPRRGGRLIV
jgi:hypothetical protein